MAGLKVRPKEPKHSTSMIAACAGAVGPTHTATAAASMATAVVGTDRLSLVFEMRGIGPRFCLAGSYGTGPLALVWGFQQDRYGHGCSTSSFASESVAVVKLNTLFAEEQTLIQPLYDSVSGTITALNNVARQRGWAWWGAKATRSRRGGQAHGDDRAA